MVRKERFKAHETFLMRDGWAYKCCHELQMEHGYDLFKSTSAVDRLGVGYNMTKAIKYWMKTMGVVEDRNTNPKGTYLTDLGTMIYTHDPYFEDIFSLWILHINCVRNYYDATAWNLFFNEFLAKEFEEQEVIRFISDLCSNKNINYVQKSIETDCKMIIKMYLDSNDEGATPEDNGLGMFSRLKLFQKRGAKIVRVKPDNKLIDKMIVLYLINLICKDNIELNGIDQEEYMCSIDQLEHGKNSIGNILGMDRTSINGYLDVLKANEYISVVRTAGLDQVKIVNEDVKNILNILELYYI